MIAIHRVELTGSLADVRFPNCCAACGAASAAGDVALEKMFRRTYSDSPTTYEFARVQLPLCRSCLLAHERAQRPIDPAVLRRLRRTWALKVLPYLFPMGVCLYIGTDSLPKTLRDLGRLRETPGDWGALLAPLPQVFFGLLFLMFLRLSISAGSPLIASTSWSGSDPNDTYIRTRSGLLGSWYVIPGAPTPTLAAVDFTDEQFEIFAPNHRTFTFANPDVAARFADVNAARAWDSNSPRARQATRRTRALAIAVFVVGIVLALVELVRG